MVTSTEEILKKKFHFCAVSRPKNRIFGSDNQFQRNDLINAEAENAEYTGDMLEPFKEVKENRVSVDKIVVSFDFSNSDHTSGQATVLVSAARTKKDIHSKNSYQTT